MHGRVKGYQLQVVKGRTHLFSDYRCLWAYLLPSISMNGRHEVAQLVKAMWVLSPIRSLEFFIDLILSTAL